MPIAVFYPVQHSRFNHLCANLKINKLLIVLGFLHIIKSTITMVEAMDVDYLKQEVNYNIIKNPLQTTTKTFTDLDRIADKIYTTTSLPIQKKNELVNDSNSKTDDITVTNKDNEINSNGHTDLEIKNGNNQNKNFTNKSHNDRNKNKQKQKDDDLEEDKVKERSILDKIEKGKIKMCRCQVNDNDELDQLSVTNYSLKKRSKMKM
ncbi:hypothetical protein F8M41_004523 [Gigaspora margarita]|uniref:Uncharacterized protein n=1 Tax=Gigaspora margarita TaxID=4874 RepID=A0A8H4A5N4_GIGMA|nr:hypothetical protein F8M41_004523 [Gigaspora margarita]